MSYLTILLVLLEKKIGIGISNETECIHIYIILTINKINIDIPVFRYIVHKYVASFFVNG